MDVSRYLDVARMARLRDLQLVREICLGSCLLESLPSIDIPHVRCRLLEPSLPCFVKHFAVTCSNVVSFILTVRSSRRA